MAHDRNGEACLKKNNYLNSSLFMLVGCLGFASPALAQSNVPDHGFYIGAGGTVSNVDFGKQDVYAVGTSDTFNPAGVLVATGSAWGPATLSMDDEFTFSPSVQGGYFQKFANSEWLWGAKFNYNYLGTTSALKNALLPQAGAFTYTGDPTPVPFTGNAVVRSYETTITHQMALIPYVGHAFENSYLYAGAGPTLSRTRTDLNGLVGFADINGNRQDISGAPQNFSESQWVYGGAATIGGTYFLSPKWFLDFSYTYAKTESKTNNYASTFVNPGSDGTVTQGTLVGTSKADVTTQGLTLTANWLF